ncbi:hypothetical protein G9A89_005254 [Geosiphon pyriformis]|nr:hypothetical protein G9A89_005254 [Geosiphon pyriformis]
MTKQFSQIQQPVESNLEKYKNRSNNSTTAQDKSTVNKKPKRKHINLETTTSTNSAELASSLIEGTAILQPIDSSDKGKQPALAPGEHLNTQTPIPSNVTSNTPPINQIMAYWDIAKLEKFSDEEDNTYSWISLAEKPTSFTEFKLVFLQYFCDPNTLIQLQNQFSIIKQNDHEAVTTYLRRFNQVLRQILTIEQNYYTTMQVLNQFIKGLRSSLLKSVQSYHSTNLQEAVTLTYNFESTEQEANHTQAIVTGDYLGS